MFCIFHQKCFQNLFFFHFVIVCDFSCCFHCSIFHVSIFYLVFLLWFLFIFSFFHFVHFVHFSVFFNFSQCFFHVVHFFSKMFFIHGLALGPGREMKGLELG